MARYCEHCGPRALDLVARHAQRVSKGEPRRTRNCLRDLRLSHRPPTVRSRSFRQPDYLGHVLKGGGNAYARTPDAKTHRFQKVRLVIRLLYQVEYTSS